jgi:hypothetical protein
MVGGGGVGSFGASGEAGSGAGVSGVATGGAGSFVGGSAGDAGAFVCGGKGASAGLLDFATSSSFCMDGSAGGGRASDFHVSGAGEISRRGNSNCAIWCVGDGAVSGSCCLLAGQSDHAIAAISTPQSAPRQAGLLQSMNTRDGFRAVSSWSGTVEEEGTSTILLQSGQTSSVPA